MQHFDVWPALVSCCYAIVDEDISSRGAVQREAARCQLCQARRLRSPCREGTPNTASKAMPGVRGPISRRSRLPGGRWVWPLPRSPKRAAPDFKRGFKKCTSVVIRYSQRSSEPFHIEVRATLPAYHCFFPAHPGVAPWLLERRHKNYKLRCSTRVLHGLRFG